MSYENNNINSYNFPDKISSSDEFKLSETPHQSSNQLIQSNKSSNKFPSSSSKNFSVFHLNSFPQQNSSLTNQIIFDSNSSLSSQNNISSSTFIPNTPATTTPSLISSLRNITSYHKFLPKQKSYLTKSDFVTSPLTNSIPSNFDSSSYEISSFHNSNLNNHKFTIYAKIFVPNLNFKIDNKYEIENGIMGIKRDSFLKLTRYMEYSK
jgi:hypothetical protein